MWWKEWIKHLRQNVPKSLADYSKHRYLFSERNWKFKWRKNQGKTHWSTHIHTEIYNSEEDIYNSSYQLKPMTIWANSKHSQDQNCTWSEQNSDQVQWQAAGFHLLLKASCSELPHLQPQRYLGSLEFPVCLFLCSSTVSPTGLYYKSKWAQQ